PVAIGKDVIARDPFTYQSYVATRHSTPSEIVNTTSDDASHMESSDDDDAHIPFTKASALHVLKQLASGLEPSNKERYEKVFVTWEVMVSMLGAYFDKDLLTRSRSQFEQWLSADGAFGPSVRLSTENGRIRGRWMWVLKRSYQVTINFREAFVQHVRSTPDIATIGYARKSFGKESPIKRTQLLQSMIEKLRSRCLARKVYVSPRCSASMPLNDRDRKADSQSTADLLSHCAGTMQDLLHRLRTNMKPIRLVIIDYAGFSTDFGDIQRFFN
ncbi:hypothetical protein DM01DRAFT_1272633, partial [Hesseltinella vesiculosa]